MVIQIWKWSSEALERVWAYNFGPNVRPKTLQVDRQQPSSSFLPSRLHAFLRPGSSQSQLSLSLEKAKSQVHVMMSICNRIHTFGRSSLHSVVSYPNLKTSHSSSIMSTSPSNYCCFTFNARSSGNRYSRISVSNSTSLSSSCSLQIFQRMYSRSGFSKNRRNNKLLVNKSSSISSRIEEARLDYSPVCQNSTVTLSLPRQGFVSKLKCNGGPLSWSYTRASAGFILGLLVCFSSSDSSYAEPPRNKNDKQHDYDEKPVKMSHGKTVHTDFSVIGIPGDGRCLFRSIAHGACLRSGKSAPSESLQREIADELRAKVADEFIKRREETEWFIEGDFNTYVSQIRKPHVWGGEPELLMLSHVLMMPITVYMRDDSSGGIISIAEYGQEYGKENPVRVLYHGFGHYDALLIPEKKAAKSRL
ncbi:hypothetical protein V2J09_023945 [Rumex salicifolius]